MFGSGETGSNGINGSNGFGGSNGSSNLAGDGGDGGRGGRGGTGGNGGSGGSGGGGGGGAGGTVKLVGSVLDASGASVNTAGGGGGNAGGSGRLLLGSNVAGASVGSAEGTNTTLFAGPTVINPFILGDLATPFIPDLLGGAEGFGLLNTGLDANSSIFDFVRDAAPTGAIGALVRLDIGPVGYADDFTGFDFLAFLNLGADDLLDPKLGIDPLGVDTDFLVDLLLGGFENDSLFGGVSDQTLDALAGFGVYGTLIPEIGTIFNFSAGGSSLFGATLEDGQVVFLTQDVPPGTGVPEPGTLALFGIGLTALVFTTRRRRKALAA